MNNLFLDLSPSIMEHSRVQRINQKQMQLSRWSSVAPSIAIRHIFTRFLVVDAAGIVRAEIRDRVVVDRFGEKVCFVEQYEDCGV